MSVEDYEPFLDLNGNERRCGSLQKPEGFVSALRTYESEKPVLDDSDIRKLLNSSTRIPRRALFGKRWVSEQFRTSACNGHAGANGLGAARALRGIQDGKQFSGAFLYSLMNGGRDQGSMLEDGMIALGKFGCAPAELVPYNQIYPKMQPPNARQEALKYKGFKAYPCETKQGFRSGIALGYVGIVAVHAGRGYQTLNSSGISSVDSGPGNHAILVDDGKIIGGTEVYDGRNSWGLGFGTEGRSYLHWDSFEQTFKHHVFYLIPSTEEA